VLTWSVATKPNQKPSLNINKGENIRLAAQVYIFFVLEASKYSLPPSDLIELM
jgi:hypothetical protein